MHLLPFDSLQPHRTRRFVPRDTDLGDWSQVAPLFERLAGRSSGCRSAQELESWLVDWSELSAALEEESSKRYIAMTCHTENLQAEKAYLHFVEKIEPELKPRHFQLAQQLMAHPLRQQLPQPRFEILIRDSENLVRLFRPENVPLETEEAKLGQKYQKLNGSLTVMFRGDERTLIQMGRYLEETDRSIRKEAWEVVANRRLLESDMFEEQFDRLLKLRHEMARNAGFDNYRDYSFQRLARFDYKPADCLTFHSAVESEVMPLVRALQASRRERLGLDTLRPWDLSVDPSDLPPLKPFENVDQLVTRTQSVFNNLDGELAAGFRRMRELRLLDLDNRKGKAPGGYQANLAEARLPFIFMNAVGVQRDVETLLHEAGHAFHSLSMREEDLLPYRTTPLEFAEVASMSMELLGGDFIGEFYSSADSKRACRTHLEQRISLFPWIATVDAFQHWVYTHPGHTRAERSLAWLELMDRFGGDVDWTGYDKSRAYAWHRQLHIFLYPFYYIEYGIAQLGAFQVWANWRADRSKALSAFKSALKLGGSTRLPDLFEAAGCRFAFDASAIRPMVDLVRRELAALA